MAEISYSVYNLSPETREFTLFVSMLNSKAGQRKIIEKVQLPRGGFVQTFPDGTAVPGTRFLRAWATGSSPEKRIHKTPKESGNIARVELRYMPTGELVAVARGADWKELELKDAPAVFPVGVPGDE